MEQPANKYELQRAEAIRAAAHVFAEKGFHGASTTEIAARLGIKQGSLYYYLKSKEEALAEVCMLAVGDYVRRMEDIAANDQPFEAKLLATITSHLMRYREKDEAFKVYNDERLYLPQSRRHELKEAGSRYRQLLEQIFERAARDGQLDPSVDCHFLAQALIGLCNAWGQHIVRDPELDIVDLINKCAALFLKGVLGDRSS